MLYFKNENNELISCVQLQVKEGSKLRMYFHSKLAVGTEFCTYTHLPLAVSLHSEHDVFTTDCDGGFLLESAQHLSMEDNNETILFFLNEDLTQTQMITIEVVPIIKKTVPTSTDNSPQKDSTEILSDLKIKRMKEEAEQARQWREEKYTKSRTWQDEKRKQINEAKGAWGVTKVITKSLVELICGILLDLTGYSSEKFINFRAGQKSFKKDFSQLSHEEQQDLVVLAYKEEKKNSFGCFSMIALTLAILIIFALLVAIPTLATYLWLVS